MNYFLRGLPVVLLLALSGCFFSNGDKPPAVPVEEVETENELPPPSPN